ncbi:ammonium transporter AmtB-like domain-containing protein [Lasiosphaeria hispida]|uniref:Ammonium transporter AmtB-like domain-containing protein n=1 Tax=Lasiosphaeria hispida TaxID=260671 RepID=A0AAJ0HKY9_9PEZI|nr:ammonium transporter AmtB-like domain-containing protein [Lasiosphaeria hispida]
MVPAISMFYSGAADRHSTLTLLRMPVITAAFCTVQWYLWGYALTFASVPGETTSTWYGGHPEAMVLYHALVQPVGAAGPKIPELLYAFYQGMFASFTPALICGGVIKKFKVGRFLIFTWLWSLLVYYPVARWTWSPTGFSSRHGIMDFAGGTAVHITSGTAVGAVVLFHSIEKHGFGIFRHAWGLVKQPTEALDGDAMAMRRRGDEGSEISITGVMMEHSASSGNATKGQGGRSDSVLAGDAPHSLNNLVLGTMLLWIGWLGFNGGSALGGNMRAVSACVSTHVAASTGGCVMLMLFWTMEWAGRKWPGVVGGGGGAKVSVVHFCDGAVVGLVAITPAAGYVPVWSAGCIGAIAALAIFVLKSTFFQHLLRGDPLFVFLIHTGGGFIGMVLTGCFARQYVVGFDGYSVIFDRPIGERVAWQIADACISFGYSLTITTAILLALKLMLRPFTGTWKLLGDDERDKLEAELEYKWRSE